MKLSNTLVVLDLETTGIWVEKDRIIEIALLKCQPDGTRETFLTKVNPGIPIPPAVSQVTGMTDGDVKEAPFFKAISKEILEFIGPADIAGFNVERFDLPLLEREMFEAGHKFEWQKHKIYDAQKIYHLNEKRDLTAAYKFYCQKELAKAHTALGDAEATFEILAGQIAKYGNGGRALETLEDFEYKNLDEYFDEGRRFRWWNGELYPMFGKYAKRCSLQEIARKDPAYLQWILTKDFSGEVKEVVQSALKGQFPVFEQAGS